MRALGSDYRGASSPWGKLLPESAAPAPSLSPYTVKSLCSGRAFRQMLCPPALLFDGTRRRHFFCGTGCVFLGSLILGKLLPKSAAPAPLAVPLHRKSALLRESLPPNAMSPCSSPWWHPWGAFSLLRFGAECLRVAPLEWCCWHWFRWLLSAALPPHCENHSAADKSRRIASSPALLVGLPAAPALDGLALCLP